jgi:hypothetical protein
MVPRDEIMRCLDDRGIHVAELHPEFVLDLGSIERERSPEVRFDERSRPGCWKRASCFTMADARFDVRFIFGSL